MAIIIICVVVLGISVLHCCFGENTYLVTYTVDTNKGREIFSSRYIAKVYKGLPSTAEFTTYLDHLHLGDNIRIIDIHKID